MCSSHAFSALPWPPAAHVFVSYSTKPAYPLGFKQNDPTQAQARSPHQVEFAR
jgi:hypothetical protein